MNRTNPYAPPLSTGSQPVRSTRGPIHLTVKLFAIHASFLVAGSAIGGLSRWLRYSFSGGIHYEAIGEVAAKVAIALILLTTCWTAALERRRLTYAFSVTGLWVGAVVGWSVVHGGVWANYLKVNVFHWAIAMAVGMVLLSLRVASVRRGGG